jgi:hypothetical protein
MAGLWISWIARRLTQPDTFDRLVSPAIADLQSEAAYGLTQRLRHYAAFTVVFGCAVLRDFRIDLGIAFGTDSARRAWGRAAVWALIAGLCNWAAMYVVTLRLLERLHASSEVQFTVLSGIASRSIGPAFTAALVVAAYSFKRQDPARIRRVVAVTLVFLALSPVVGYLSDTLYAAAREALVQAYRVGQPDLPAIVSASTLVVRLSAIMQMATFAWLGVALARYRGWTLAITTTTILTLYVIANLHQFELVNHFAPSLTPLLYGTYSIPANAVTLGLLILLCRAILRPFEERARPGSI